MIADEKPLYHRIRHGRWRGLVMARIGEERVLERLVSVGDEIRAGRARLIKQAFGRTSATMVLVIDGHTRPIYVKEDCPARMGARKWLLGNFRRSRPAVTWRRTLQLQAAGIPVQRPVALLECRRWGLIDRVVYVGEYLPNAELLAAVLSRQEGPGGHVARLELLAAVAKELRAMHDRGFYHNDLKAVNVLAERRADRWGVIFIDLEGVVAKRRLTGKERAIDLGRLWLALLPMTTPAERERLLDAYAAVAPAIDRLLLRELIDQRVDDLKARRFDRLPEIGAALRGQTNQPGRWVVIALEPPQRALHMTPLFALLRQSFPTMELDLVADDGVARALEQNPDVRAIISVSGTSVIQMIRLLRSHRYQVAIDLTDSVRSAVLTRATGATVRIGYRTASALSKWLKRATCYTQMIMARPEQRNPVQHYLLVAEALGVDGDGPKRHAAAAS